MWFLLKYPVTGISQQLLVFRKSSIQLSCLRQINSVFRVAIQLNFQALSPESLPAIKAKNCLMPVYQLLTFASPHVKTISE